MTVDWNILAPYFSIPVKSRKPSAAQREYAKAMAAERGRSAAALAKARKLAAAHPRIDIERERANEYWVTCDDLTGSPADPCDGGNFCTDGHQVLDVVETYIAHLTKA